MPAARRESAARRSSAGRSRPRSTLKRASRRAPQITNRNAPSQAARPSGGQRERVEHEGRAPRRRRRRRPASRTPPRTGVVVLVSRATLPSSMSMTMRHEDGQRRLGVALLDGQDEGAEPAEQIAGREQARQEEDPPPRLLAQLLPAPPLRPRRAPHVARRVSASSQHPHHRSPRRGPGPPPAPASRVAARHDESVRDPKRISPYRSPAASLSPGRTRHTMRRASTPGDLRHRHARRCPPPGAACSARSAPTPPAGTRPGSVPATYSTVRTTPADRRAVDVDVERRQEDRHPHRRADPRILDLRDRHHRAVGGGQHRARHRGRASARDPGRSPGRPAPHREHRRGAAPAHRGQDTRGRRGGTDERPPLRGYRDAHAGPPRRVG